MASFAEDAEKLAHRLPPERSCKNNTWKRLRSSDLIDDLATVFKVLLDARPEPPEEVRTNKVPECTAENVFDLIAVYDG